MSLWKQNQDLLLWAQYDACCESGKIKRVKGNQYWKNHTECEKCGDKHAIEYWISIDEYLPDGRLWNTNYEIVGFYCYNCNAKWGKWW